MPLSPIVLRIGDAPEIEAYLAERIYEFNSKATGRFDGESFSATRRDESGVIRAGISGYTWGGCCYVSYLWVEERERGNGLGTALLLTAEEHARAKDCVVLFVSSHSFQSPGFYERKGYKLQAVVHDHPVGHTNIFFAKRLETQ